MQAAEIIRMKGTKKPDPDKRGKNNTSGAHVRKSAHEYMCNA